MRICPSCKATYSAGETECAIDGELLVEDESELSLSDTMRSSRAGGTTRATPSPVVRQSPTPAPERPADTLVGQKLAARYEILRKIGEGGMGAVYEARHLKIDKRVAVKVLLDKFIQKADVVARLEQEAKLASAIGHENIVDINDFGETDDGRTFVVMEFLEGESLAQQLQREGPLLPERAVGIARQVASALAAAHGKGIVHRDVKPENIFITRRGERDFVKVVDFGISKAMRPPDLEEASPRLTQTGMVLGTPLYLSPEQARGEEQLDHRIDIYALGVILYEMLTGEVPFQGANYLAIISQILSQEPKPLAQARPDLGISPALEQVVRRAMHKDRDQRYRTMAEFDADLGAVESGAEARLSVPPPSAPQRLGTAFLWLGAVGAVVAGVAVAVPRMLRRVPPPAPPPELRVAPPPAPPPAPEPKPAPRPIKAHVTSVPDGAKVLWGDVDMGVTPVDIEVPVSDDKIQLTLRRDGYEDSKPAFFPTRDQDVKVILTKRVEAAKPVRRPKPVKPSAPAPPDRGPTSSGEIKPSPYEKK
ncbi:MAG TPA: serine/threonine-protein kinase [Haliangiales bacterium]|nr:serine/threonine-protein kinase [Haliangiales bacterium]